jgi:hypothetical protein
MEMPNRMGTNDSYLVRVKNLADVAGSFTWEVCRGDGLLVLLRSTKTFPTRVEALFDSAQNAAVLALATVQSPSSVSPPVAGLLDLHGPL